MRYLDRRGRKQGVFAFSRQDRMQTWGGVGVCVWAEGHARAARFQFWGGPGVMDYIFLQSAGAAAQPHGAAAGWLAWACLQTRGCWRVVLFREHR